MITLVEINGFLEHWYPLCWSLVFLTEMCVGIAILCVAIKEYKYDENKDLKKQQRKTRTTKKTTKSMAGDSTTEETTEVIEPIETVQEEKHD